MTTSTYNLPLPRSQPETDFYWEKTKAHELWLRRCNDCQKMYFYPRFICPMCFSRNTSWAQSSGWGTLYAFSIVHRPPNPAWRGNVPYIIALVELEDGVRFPTNLVGMEPDPEQVKIGMAVQVVFEDVTPEVTLPKFRPA